MRPESSIITLLTDFGSQDYFVGAMKGVILSINPDACIVDITHEIPPQDIHAGAFNLLASYKSFPSGTIQLAVVDPGVGSARRPILVESGGQYFVGPDNGIFSWVCQREGNYRVFHLTNDKFFRLPLSATFHGRDLFAPVAAALSKGVAPEEFGPQIGDLVQLESVNPKADVNGMTEARIIHVDRFGNCITNLTRENFGEQLDNAKLIINDRQIESFREFFADADDQKSELFGVFGSSGFLEIAKQNASASEALHARRGERVLLIAGDSN